MRLQKLSKEFIGWVKNAWNYIKSNGFFDFISYFRNLSNAWFQVSLQFDSEAEMHKMFSSVLQEEIIKPLKYLYENQTKSRKPVI